MNNFFNPNQNMNNPYGYNNFQQPPYGAYGVPQQPQVKFSNVLTPEEINKLKKNATEFTLNLTEEDILKSRCNHLDTNGELAIVTDQETGLTQCKICGYKFNPIAPDTLFETLQDSVNNIIDILQTIKLFYPDFPTEAAKQYFQIIPLLEKAPKLFVTAAEHYSKFISNDNNNYFNRGMGTAAQFQNLAAMFSGAGFSPNFNQQPNNGFYNQQNPAPGAFGYAGSATPQSNPFGQPGGPNPAQSYNVPNTGFQYVPPTANAAPSAVVPEQPAQVGDGKEESTTVKEKFNV